MSRCDHAFAVCNAGGCQLELEVELLEANLSADSSNIPVAASDNIKRGSVRGIALKSIHNEDSEGETRLNDSVETALSAGGGGEGVQLDLFSNFMQFLNFGESP